MGTLKNSQVKVGTHYYVTSRDNSSVSVLNEITYNNMGKFSIFLNYIFLIHHEFT
jgi:hypothetical protein